MSKEESSRGGLLSKVVRFVRNPTVDWSALDTLAVERESQFSKEALKELMERKRRNDFVRRREFAQLRQLRQRGVQQPQRNEEPAADPSCLSELNSPGERAATLQKIDEIEAQMSQQWWKGAPRPARPDRPLETTGWKASQPPGDTTARAFAPTEAGSLPPVPVESAEVSGPPVVALQPPEAPGAPAAQAPAALPAAQAAFDGTIPHPPAVPAPRPAEGEPEKFVHAPELEEAAIRFAQADFAGAEKALQEALALSQQAEPAVQEEFWLALFDLYRATGQAERFDALAIDFAARFGRSAPLWVSLPEQLGQPGIAGAADGISAAARRSFGWSAPPTFTAALLVALRAALERAAPPWTLNWARLAAIEPEVVPQLTALFSRWAEDRTVQLVFAHAQVLHALLAEKTPSGDRSTPAAWWLLRMACLRLMGRVDEFELVALDYCVTYEVSPPAWEPPHCSCIDGEEPHAADATAQQHESLLPQDMLASGTGTLSLSVPLDAGPVPALSGQIEGDCSALLPPLEAHLRPGEPLVIDCEHLIRTDFAAAGTLLNWAAEQQAKGQQLQFDKLHRLVAILFNVLGINEHAWVVVRKK